MSGVGSIPARVLIDELVRRLGADDATRVLGLSNPGELLTAAVDLDSQRPPEVN
ncbi:MAG TPA: hypothetical protein VII18_20075 [Mycobacterium sp.]